MKKSLKKAALLAMTGAMLVGTAMSAKAASLCNGQWCSESNGYWFKLTEDGKVFLANTWYWIKDSDGVVKCYYFDQNGWLATNQVIGDYTVNDQGQWVVDGVIQTKADTDVEFATHTDLSAKTTAAAVETTTTTDNSTASPINAGAATTANAKSSKAKAYKSSGAGDNPANATFTQAYSNSTISGSTATNSWANFTVSFSGSTLKTDSTGTGTDFYIDSDDKSSLYVTYYPINKYGAASLDNFVSGFLADARGFKGGSMDSDKTLGAYTFKQLSKKMTTPDSTYYDHAYIRQVDGTNYVQVITVEQNGFSQTYVSDLSTMAKVN